jgi:hypothetical protein
MLESMIHSTVLLMWKLDGLPYYYRHYVRNTLISITVDENYVYFISQTSLFIQKRMTCDKPKNRTRKCTKVVLKVYHYRFQLVKRRSVTDITVESNINN